MASMRIAVASSDGKVINSHFGHAGQFLVFDLDETGFRWIETRTNEPACHAGEHSDCGLAASVNRIADCELLLVARAGPGAIRLLASAGVRTLEVADYIPSALGKLVESRRKGMLRSGYGPRGEAGIAGL